MLRNASSILIAFSLGGALPAQAAAQPPNIVLIMADDMGFTDIGCYGSEIATPNLDRLATDGVRFTQFYNTSRCCPTRASLLTGLYSHQAGIGLMTGDRGYDAYRGDLNRRCVTLAEALRPAGYRCYMSGKWHVTKHVTAQGPRHNWPLQRGFDRFYGTIIGAGSFYDPATLCRGNTFITPENDPEYRPETFYYSDAITDNAVTFVTDHGTKEGGTKPFFLYVSYTCAHWPMHAPAADIARYDGVYDQGFAPIRAARHKRAVELGILRKDWSMSAQAEDWAKTPHKDWDIRNMECYAAMIDRMDQGIGKIVAALKKSGTFDNTMILYLQDNGGCAEGFGRRSNKEKIAGVRFPPLGKDGLQKKIWPPMQARDGRPVRTGPEAMAGPDDSFVAYGRGWANVSNTPFRGYKHDGLEGGISTPLIVHWPKGIPAARRGAFVRQPCHLIDVMPTLLAAAGAAYPTEHRGEAIQAMEGVNLLPTLAGSVVERGAPLCFEHHGNLAMRDGRYKIVSMFRRNQPRTWQLYDMVADRTETRDLAAAQPERLRKMIAVWQRWADRVGVQPWPFPNRRKAGDPGEKNGKKR